MYGCESPVGLWASPRKETPNVTLRFMDGGRGMNKQSPLENSTREAVSLGYSYVSGKTNTWVFTKP